MSWEIGKDALRTAAVAGAVFLVFAVRASEGAQSGPQAKESAGATDLRKHEALAAGAQKTADGKRAIANQRESKARSIDGQIADLERGQSARSTELTTQRSDLLRFEAENPQLDAANRKLAEEIALSQQELAARLAALDPIAQSRRTLAEQLSRELTTLATFVQRLDRANADSRRVSQDVADLELDLQDDSLSLRETLDRRNDELQNLSRANSEIGAIPFEIAQRERELRQVQSEIPTLRQRFNAAEGARRRQEQEMAPFRQDAAEARREVDDANRAFRAIQTQVDGIHGNIQKTDQRIAQAKNQLAALDRDNATDSDRERQARESSAASENAVPALVARKPSVDQTRTAAANDVARLLSEKQPLEGKIDSVENEITRLQRDASAGGRLAELRAELATLKAQQTKNNADLNRRREESSAAQREAERLDAEIAAARRNVTDAIRLAEQLRAAIAKREGSRANAVQEIDRLSATRQSAQTELDRVLPRFDEARQRVQTAEARLRPVEQDLRREEAALERIERDAQQVRRSLDADLDDRRALEDRVRELEMRRSELQTFSAQVSDNIRAFDIQIPALQSRVRAEEIDLNRLRSQENALRQSRATAETEHARQSQIVKGLQDQFQDLDQRVNALTERNRSVAALIERNQKQIAENNETMRRNTSSAQSLRANIPQTENAITLAGNRLPTLRSASAAAWAEFKPADTDASAAETAAAAAATKLAEVRAAYDRQRQDSRQTGEKQGIGPGAVSGRSQGVTDGQAAGQELGAAAGRQEGLAAGLARGAADGSKKGSDEGYSHGFEAPANYQEGLAKGIEQGARDAWEEARRVDNPKGHAARRTELMAGIPTLPLEPRNAAELTDPDAATKASEELKSQQPAKPSGAAATVAGGPVGDILPTRIAVPTPPNNVSPNCDLGYADLNQACMEGFKAALQSSYADAYTSAFRDSRDRTFATARRAAFDANMNVRYAEGYDSAYKTAHAEGDRKGAADAREKGYADGRSQGFNRTIAEARATEFEKGRDDESRYFAANPVVRVVAAAFSEIAPDDEAGDIVAGDTLALELTLANFGGIAAAPGTVRAQLREFTPRIATTAGELQLGAIPASTTTAVFRTPLASVPDVPENSEISARVVVTLPDGETQQIPLSTIVAANLPMTIEQLSTETNPRIGKSYSLTVKFRNSSLQDTFNDLRVVLSADPSLARIDKAEARVKKLKANQTGEADLKFTILAPVASGKTIPLKITLFHGRNVSARATATVAPKP